MGTSTPPPASLRLLLELAQVQRILGWRGALRYLSCLARRLPQVMVRRSLGPADALMRGSLRLRSGSGSRLQLSSGDFGVVREIFGSRCYDVDDWIGRSRRFVDLGANEGMFSLYALAAHPDNRITAVEAQSALCANLTANLKRNGLETRARVICGLAGGSNSQIAPLAGDLAVVDMEQLLAGPEGVDFLKVDIEGSEFALFADCATWVGRVRFIAMEIHHDCGDSEVLKRILIAHGLRLHKEARHRDLGYLFFENAALAPQA